MRALPLLHTMPSKVLHARALSLVVSARFGPNCTPTGDLSDAGTDLASVRCLDQSNQGR